MFAVIYRFYLKPEQVSNYKKHWDTLTHYFINECGAIGSCLHQAQNNIWIAYSRWPDRITRDNAWPGGDAPNQALPKHIQDTIKAMQAIRKANEDQPQFEEIAMDVIMDKLL